MRQSKRGKTAYIRMGVWYNEATGNIHMSAPGVPGFKLTTVRQDPKSKRGHPHLFTKLAHFLRDSGVSAPLATVTDA